MTTLCLSILIPFCIAATDQSYARMSKYFEPLPTLTMATLPPDTSAALFFPLCLTSSVQFASTTARLLTHGVAFNSA